MSDYEHHYGKLTPIEHQTNLSTQEVAKTILNLNKIPLDADEDFITQLNDELYGKFICIKDKIYKIDDKEHDSSDDIIRASLHSDNSITYEVRYYNGGCGFGEALEEALKKITPLSKELSNPKQINLIDMINEVENESHK